ncbi:MAG: tyrosine-type recombinase/integrase [Alphaproteobacteria bacterium]|nr:tyrosine-type recombinase/integrase [Alphaproteobacteria bacterium]
MTKLTKRFVESIIPDLEKPLKIWDSELKGFGVVVLPSGRRTYCIEYRNADRVKKRLKVGVHGPITAEQARDFAKQHLAKVTQGADPVADKNTVRQLHTVLQLADDYLERHGIKKRERSLLEDQRILKTIILPDIGNKKVLNVTHRDIESIHLKLQKTPYFANRVVALLSKMFSLAFSWGWCTENPAKGIERYQEQKRDRWLDREEMERLWNALDKYSHHPTSYVFKLLLLTGARRGEILSATWDQFNLEKGMWSKPSHLTKQKKNEHLPLSSNALEVLLQLKKAHPSKSPYLFPGNVDGKPLAEVKTFWKTVLIEAEIEDFRIHDLRHTHASHLVSSGLSLSIVGKLLGHTQTSTTQRYAHLADTPLREAAELFGNMVGKKKG